MGMFILTKAGRPQNLMLLQRVVVRKSKKEPGKFALVYVQENGQAHEDKIYDTFEEAKSVADEIRAELLT